MATNDQIKDALSHLRETTNLAEQGSFCCNRCRKVRPLTEGIVVTWGGQVFFAQCPNCFSEAPIVIQEGVLSDGRIGIKVGFLNPADAPLIVLPKEIHRPKFIAQAALAQRKKTEFSDE